MNSSHTIYPISQQSNAPHSHFLNWHDFVLWSPYLLTLHHFLIREGVISHENKMLYRLGNGRSVDELCGAGRGRALLYRSKFFTVKNKQRHVGPL
jgi:hypothetical protein